MLNVTPAASSAGTKLFNIEDSSCSKDSVNVSYDRSSSSVRWFLTGQDEYLLHAREAQLPVSSVTQTL